MAAFIAFLQWRLARLKLVLDLFDRRVSTVEELMGIASEVTARAPRVEMSSVVRFHSATQRARFLFADDVMARVYSAHEAVAALSAYSEVAEMTGEDGVEQLKARHGAVKNLITFYQDLPDLVAPIHSHDAEARPCAKLVRKVG